MIESQTHRLERLLSRASAAGFLITVDPHRPFEANEDDWGYTHLYKGTDANAAVSAVLAGEREGIMLIWLEAEGDHHWVRITCDEVSGATIETCTQHVLGWTTENSCLIRIFLLEDINV